jgi:hypothetical protein
VPHFPTESCPTSQRNAAPLQMESVPHFDRNPQLELEVFGEDIVNGRVTWEEFQHFYYALHPELAREKAKTDPNVRRILESPPPRRLARLIER